MSDALESAAQDWYRKGTEAMNRQNWDFAVECFGNSLKMKPENVLFRQMKHGCCEKMYGGNGSGAKMAGMKLMGIRGKIKKARGKEDWKTMASLAEEGLNVNPWDAQLFADLGEASWKLEWGEIAKYGLSKAVKADPGNVGYNRLLGQILFERGDYKEARLCYKRIYEADPTDGDARSMMGRIDAEAVMDRGGYEKAENTQDVKADKPTNAYDEDRQARRGGKGPNEAVAPGESEEMDLRAQIRKDPENVAHYLKLADYLRGERKLAQAIEEYDKALEIVGKDTSIVEQREDVEIEIMREKAAEALEKFRKNPDRERLKEKATNLKKELTAREIEVLSVRVENHPNDMRMKFTLAELYRKTKQYKLGIPLYQQAVADTRMKEQALVALGESFVRTGKMDLGRRQFDKALETLTHNEQPDAFKNAHYYLARIYEKAEKNEEAENHYNEILGVDYEYRDVQKRLEEIQRDDSFEEFDDGDGLD